MELTLTSDARNFVHFFPTHIAKFSFDCFLICPAMGNRILAKSHWLIDIEPTKLIFLTLTIVAATLTQGLVVSFKHLSWTRKLQTRREAIINYEWLIYIERESNEWMNWLSNSRHIRFDFDQPSQFSPVLKRLQLSRSRHMWQYTGLGQLKFFLVKEWPWLSTIVCFRFRTDPSVRPEMKELYFFYSYNTLLTFLQPTMSTLHFHLFFLNEWD